jgi:hypothetical protein
MSSQPVPPLNFLHCRVLAALAAICSATFLIGLIAQAVMWMVPDWAPVVARLIANLQSEPMTLTRWVRVLGLLVSTPYLSILVWGSWLVHALFERLAKGLVFEPETGRLLRRIGMTLLVYAGLTPIFNTAMPLLVTLENAPGESLLRIGFSTQDMTLAIVGALVLVIGSVMAEAARMADENRQIV